jgi:molybdopterin-containing oxidoreductase family iron-sulfur binding subunit
VCIVPGQAEETLGLSLGWGRYGRGTNAYVFERSVDIEPSIAKTGLRRDLPRTQPNHSLAGRDDEIAPRRTLTAMRAQAPRKKKRALTLYELSPTAAKQWGMAIDLSRCTGCGACVVACQAENNVPTVGPDGVAMGRVMHWLRIDTYFTDDEQVVSQPMLCQHCEKAPCEYVCPVNATVHSPDGLNEMVYNRCVGTRFCSNNCPYKVRRFNWFDYHRTESAPEQLAHNPDVTVRERGVMEKCTFCVQRLREHGIRTERGESPSPVQTACAQACATRAIVFGNIADHSSEVALLHASDRAHAALEELGTEPRVRYLTRIRNVNPELA